MSRRLRLLAASSLALVPAAPAVHAAVGTETPAKYQSGKVVYREFCGHCHALKEARSVGFGAAQRKGPGEDGGPSFNPLRVSYQISVLAITGTWDGHDRIVTKMTWKQIHEVSKFVQVATRDHKRVAKLPSDAY